MIIKQVSLEEFKEYINANKALNPTYPFQFTDPMLDEMEAEGIIFELHAKDENDKYWTPFINTSKWKGNNE
jgi:hypothetical protein